jgi:hypothetical protein
MYVLAPRYSLLGLNGQGATYLQEHDAQINSRSCCSANLWPALAALKAHGNLHVSRPTTGSRWAAFTQLFCADSGVV